MSGGLINTTTLAWFKNKLLGVVDDKLAGKQDAGEYVTSAQIADRAKYQDYGEARDRDSSKPTYGLE